MQQGLVISDLHLFSRRSRAEELLAGMEVELRDVDILVLNGDVFDFRWSTLPDLGTSTSAALRWMDKMAELRQGRATHYLLGNHDCHTAFTERLSEVSEKHTSLECHDQFLVIGRNVFLHGDCANRRMDSDALSRFRESWSKDTQRGPISRLLYDGADALGASRKVHDWWFPQRNTVLRVAHHLDHILAGWREEIDHCYFGHTHLPFTGHSHGGVVFHNTGSAIRGMAFQPLAFTCPPTPART